MRRRLWAFLPGCCLLMAASFAVAAPDTASFAAGNAAYQRAQYEAARQHYLAQWQQGSVTPALLYNLGNVALKLEQPGWAVLYYQRAALQAPRDRDLRANLAVALASRRVPAASEPPGWLQAVWQAMRGYFSLNELAAVALLLYLACCGLLIAQLREGHFRRRHVWVLTAGLTTMLLFAALAFSAWQTDYHPSRAVVVAEATLYSGPADTFPAVRAMYAGEQARILRTEGFWREIELENRTRGWALQSAVEPVRPPSGGAG